ncbi:MAG: alpha-L-fucosidase [Chitinivibrionales bacterium]|nr:alpha-L-fucosidase [Chitinivibrionales bacterium]
MSTTTYPHGNTAWFTRDRLGMFIHWGLYSCAARHEWVMNREELTVEQYRKYFEHFNPDLFDPVAWARHAKNAGMKYFVITTKHHEGFCLWDTRYTDYKVTNTPCGKELIGPLVEAFRNEGLKVGFYYSLIDWRYPDFPVDARHPQRNDSEFRTKTQGRDVSRYAAYMRNQVEELLTRFGPVDIIWFDFSYPGHDGKGKDDWESEKLLSLVRKLQPDILINNRLDLNGAGDFVTPEQYQPHGKVLGNDGKPLVWEACQTFSGSWGYHRDEQTWKSIGQILRMLIDGVAKGGNLLLNVGPTARGEFDFRAIEKLEQMGQWMRVNGVSIYECGPAPDELTCPPDCRYTFNATKNRLYLHLFAWPFRFLHLQNLIGKIEYAQFLHDASEILFEEHTGTDVHDIKRPKNCVTLKLPAVKPPIEIPVIELFLK